ncbi:MAG: acyltransferase [Pseudodesulfovibrio sp.]|nr:MULTISPECIES: acyltransferase [Pseudodesulfovibrio]MBU4191691.1 acyltransferase [Pseudomonadota bacterium]MBU4242845.1 acyltransferase [Pseudomonadota bacterium]MBU4379642.1 acyltransferase [Pseudomonadota bacterium]MBU4476354.1 acyltransferase [Pseudomonadota bacterium]MBU4515442.1 acyltransferase [Pseudomonadota bacterium]
MGIIRLLLAIAVLNSHFTVAPLPMIHGHEAVLCFFAISGFYMALILDTRYGSARQFYLSRFLTLYPAYVLAVALSVGLVMSLDVHPMSSRAEMAMLLSDPVTFLVMAWTSLGILGQELLFCLSPAPNGGLQFLPAARDSIWRNAPLIQGWSLSLEIMFYALAPLLVRLRSRTLLALVCASLALRLAVPLAGTENAVFFKRFFPLELWLFAGGILSYRFHALLPRRPGRFDYPAFAVLAAALLLAGLIPQSVAQFVLPCVVLATMPFVFRSFGQFRFDRFTGKLSYPFYLFHFSVVALFETLADSPEGWDILLVSLAVALLVHALFEPGAEMLKRRLRKGRPDLAPLRQQA